MTIFATQPETGRRIAEIDACKRGAWTAYREDLRDLAGRAYDDAEPACWELLQATLRDLDAERAAVAETAVTH